MIRDSLSSPCHLNLNKQKIERKNLNNLHDLSLVLSLSSVQLSSVLFVPLTDLLQKSIVDIVFVNLFILVVVQELYGTVERFGVC